MAYGLEAVVPGRIDVVRGFDLAKISFMKGDSVWIVLDPLTTREMAGSASLDQPKACLAKLRGP
jgi:alkyl sulfatase BDS1-like metallo-beta-lactamase superfamily hydrolase